MKRFIYLCCLSCFVITASAFATPQDEARIREIAEKYVQAYNNHDPKAVASFWSEEGQYINPDTRETFEGRKAIEKGFAERFAKDSKLKLKVEITSITFPSENQAIETGLFHIIGSDGKTKETAFKIFLEKENNEWLIEAVRHVDIAAVPNQYEHLKELQWLIGDWVDADEDVEIHVTNKWDESKNLIIGKFSVIAEGKLELQGTQIIVWDPIKEKIRSWFFDSDGGFGESTWIKDEKFWVAKTLQTLPDGSLASATNIYTPVNADSYKWESVDREISGQLLPDINPVTVIRKQIQTEVKNEK